MRLLLLLLAVILGTPALAAPPLVLAAASLQESLTAAADAWARRGHNRPVLSFAASSALARQIVAGAPADLFLSADEPWMDIVQQANRIVPGTRASFLANRLVLIAPAATARPVAIRRGMPLARLLGGGRLAMAEPNVVPAGKYGRQALTRLGIWPALAPRIAAGDSVRAALALVERGEAPYGIVYLTDARASAKVRIVGTFPPASHAPITYPIARLTAARSAEAEPFRRFLLSPAGKAIFRRYGFLTR
jgi:molybdate transport system substrate-binding protein